EVVFMKSRQTWFACMLALLLAVGLAVPALARYDYVANSTSDLSISGSTATVKGYVRMTAEGESIEMTTSLLLDGAEIESWSTPTSEGSNWARITKSVRLYDRGDYQVVTEYIVYGPDDSESGASYSNTETY
ncbi:hypothetical protein, partial [Anaerotruncus massiliensis (ex Liu et al. 2021)]|uniref:hypothetical protein n=1 Tax=Anaerotruncus massiliensis (ex Liu et al. 2021) TaxID=2321404 RepID=UPI003AB1555C